MQAEDTRFKRRPCPFLPGRLWNGHEELQKAAGGLSPRLLAVSWVRASGSQHRRPCTPGPLTPTCASRTDLSPEGVTLPEVMVQHIGVRSGQRVSVLCKAVASRGACVLGAPSTPSQARLSVRCCAHRGLCLEGWAEQQVARPLPRGGASSEPPARSLLHVGPTHSMSPVNFVADEHSSSADGLPAPRRGCEH